jgi:short-subunit dehydrogenase
MKIIIVGASSGMGKELALQYLAQGHLVGITGRREALLHETAAAWTGKCFAQTFDVTGNENIAHIRSLIETLGGLDLLIYSSGFGHPSDHLDEATEISTTRTNVNGFVEIAAYVFNYFVEQGGGQIAVISSVAGVRGGRHAPAYNASKAYVSNYAEGLNLKAANLGKNITVTDIRAGFVNTHMAKGEGQFWVADVQKAAAQIRRAIATRLRVAYITKRWRLVAWLFRRLPYALYRKL